MNATHSLFGWDKQVLARRAHRAALRAKGLCVARWDDQWCERPLTVSDRLDNVDGYCAECAGILSDTGDW